MFIIYEPGKTDKNEFSGRIHAGEKHGFRGEKKGRFYGGGGLDIWTYIL